MTGIVVAGTSEAKRLQSGRDKEVATFARIGTIPREKAFFFFFSSVIVVGKGTGDTCFHACVYYVC